MIPGIPPEIIKKDSLHYRNVTGEDIRSGKLGMRSPGFF